jgi:hypothetical protein
MTTKVKEVPNSLVRANISAVNIVGYFVAIFKLWLAIGITS